MKHTNVFLLASVLLFGCSSPETHPEIAEDPLPAEEEVALETAKPGMVMFRFKKMPLGEVLTKFEEQAGVKIKWTGSERFVTLRMIQPMEWREALELVCQFTRTHAAIDYQGRLLLKNGYGGTLNADNALLAEERRRQTQISVSGVGGGSASASGGSVASNKSSPSKARKAKYPSGSGQSKGYRATTANSRGSRVKGIKYGKGRDPTTIFDSIGGVTHH